MEISIFHKVILTGWGEGGYLLGLACADCSNQAVSGSIQAARGPFSGSIGQRKTV